MKPRPLFVPHPSHGIISFVRKKGAAIKDRHAAPELIVNKMNAASSKLRQAICHFPDIRNWFEMKAGRG